MNLQEEYKEETGREVLDSISGFTVYKDDYIEWLEEKLIVANNFINNL